MKKFFLIIVILLLQNTCFATTDMTFIYINGSNNNNEKMRNWFLNGVRKLHPELKTKIEKNEEMQKFFLNDGELVIEKSPNIFFWGDKSQEDLKYMTDKVQAMKGLSPLVAYTVRSVVAECLHDAIWVQKTHNMIPILDDLDKKVKIAASQNKKVVMLGYSAGTFITYEYMFTKLPYINISEYFKEHPVDKQTMEFIHKNPKKNTCLFALVNSDILDISQTGKMVNNNNLEELVNDYKKMDFYTETYCAPENVLYGVINFASPFPLFYSDIEDYKIEVNIFNKYMYKYLIEHDFFWLTVNFVEDPLGFPTGKNLTNSEIKDIIGVDYNQQLGFVYDYPKTWSHRTFIMAHTSYWSARKIFSSAIIKGYLEGHRYQYDYDFQTKMLKQRWHLRF